MTNRQMTIKNPFTAAPSEEHQDGGGWDHRKETIATRGKVGITFKMRQVSSSGVTYTRGQGKVMVYAPVNLTMLPIIEDTCCEALTMATPALPPSF